MEPRIHGKGILAPSSQLEAEISPAHVANREVVSAELVDGVGLLSSGDDLKFKSFHTFEWFYVSAYSVLAFRLLPLTYQRIKNKS